MPSETKSALFQPIRVGEVVVQHRVVLAPLTRVRGYNDHVPGPLAALYYAQRASEPGTLLITEATFISGPASGYPNIPGIYTDAQIEGWKEVTNAVHAKRSFIYLQIWALGRAAMPQILAMEGHELVGAANIPLKENAQQGHADPRPVTIPEIKAYVQMFATAAKNAIKAGFDGVEVHSANGYLIDQFLQDVSNTREDAYGGSIENRARFGLEILDAVIETIGASKTGVRISPWSEFRDMRMTDPVPTFSYYVTEIRKRNIAYLSVIEPGVGGDEVVESTNGSNDFIRKIWGESPYITSGGYTRERALKTAEESNVLIAFGRSYLANPDLPRRLRENLPMTQATRSKYYLVGNHTPDGYTDWDFADSLVEAV
ncbi:FMN-linked oxidoreductase [Coniophora puteana RWD-64-598 SS2]|uniref:FMN-linked oxidoreductase n=1 Tax=Coniophora puteana (strain RWD-64-598) TaxID=741705 RepID=R7SEH0_CONPW|nr:FMN-linked oxidoreductase [Coniophora puteana RWD-64-598 SS2]EIW74581.1 FMN-linked oxidoreductase [Coniophora puteana RWD-64-598 SS2]